jgi:hypothetical protein
MVVEAAGMAAAGAMGVEAATAVAVVVSMAVTVVMEGEAAVADGIGAEATTLAPR